MQGYGLPASTGAAHPNIYSLLFPRRLPEVQRTGIFFCETVGNVSRLSKIRPEGYSATFTLKFPKGKLLNIIMFYFFFVCIELVQR